MHRKFKSLSKHISSLDELQKHFSSRKEVHGLNLAASAAASRWRLLIFFVLCEWKEGRELPSAARIRLRTAQAALSFDPCDLNWSWSRSHSFFAVVKAQEVSFDDMNIKRTLIAQHERGHLQTGKTKSEFWSLAIQILKCNSVTLQWFALHSPERLKISIKLQCYAPLTGTTK